MKIPHITRFVAGAVPAAAILLYLFVSVLPTATQIHLLIAAIAVPVAIRCICIVHRMSRLRYQGGFLHFVALGASFVVLATGAVAIVLGLWQVAALLLIVGLCGLTLLDRRRTICMMYNRCDMDARHDQQSKAE